MTRHYTHRTYTPLFELIALSRCIPTDTSLSLLSELGELAFRTLHLLQEDFREIVPGLLSSTRFGDHNRFSMKIEVAVKPRPLYNISLIER